MRVIYNSKRSKGMLWDIWPLSNYHALGHISFSGTYEVTVQVLLLITYWQSFLLVAAPDHFFPQQPELLWLWGSCSSSLSEVFSKPWWVCRSTLWLMQHCKTGIPLVACTLRNGSATVQFCHALDLWMTKSGSWIIIRQQTCYMGICLCSVLVCAGTRTCSGTSCRMTRGYQDLSLPHILYTDSFTMRNVWRIISFPVVILLSLIFLRAFRLFREGPHSVRSCAELAR